MNLEVSPDPMPEEVFFVRSDQYSFVQQGVPAVFLSEGFKTVDPKLNGKSISLEWESTIYHTPQDDMKQPLNFEAAREICAHRSGDRHTKWRKKPSVRIGTPAISS